ncbi:unnamed protein product (macronuclear) [Paramecium tetraurelia]|uniref:Protein kinase domain-containing protein n=1 Tax=Paramecium tetraurelia TaxID=5888 RepID=A0D7Z8_PARTE|nr:uncharacterized protein GSPATT00014132001 [Paramecium tetraurelia]CAK79165.1 unnamed protein product [Paramecium tetraurelia]|eukprot:XP_001446562.1 hypothetical protein (macronuclear) [Paramecium tetraurelia strain d4-2]
MIITGCGNFYQTIKQLGSGSFGSVYLVKDLNTQYEFACKIISKHLINMYNASQMIQSEIAIHSSCNHKNIVKFYSYWEDQNNIYILLEYCSKGHLINPKTQFTEDEVFQIFHQILSGVDYLHQHNIIHRDLKFENVLIHEDGTLKLCDFGWAIKVQQLPVENVMCGTTEYMPPEVVSKQVLDFKVDTWSLGVILYELLHGSFPFNGHNQLELIQNITTNQLLIFRSDGVSEDLINLIQALLIKNPELRPTVQQIYLCKWVKTNMKTHNIFNHYENESLKLKVKQKNIALKVVHDVKYLTPNKKMKTSHDDVDGKSTNSINTIQSISTNTSPKQNKYVDKFFNFIELFKNF